MRSTTKRMLLTAVLGAGFYAAARTAAALSRRYDFRNRLVVITGGSRGLGLLMARQLAAEAAALVICARNAEELDKAANELSQGLHDKLVKDGIYVTTVCPGLMRTGSPRHPLIKGRHRAEYAWFSIGGALPTLSTSADRAARQIINACRYGRAKVVLSLPAKLAARANALAPELTADVSALVARLLPEPGGVGRASVKGYHSTSEWSLSFLTTLSDRAAERNNELSVGR